MFLLQCTSEREIGDLFTSDSQGMIVIDAVLYVDRPMPEIFISLSQVPDTHYDNELWGINDAEVIVYQGPSTYQYQSTGSLGKYLPPSGAPAILPETEYRILVQALGRKVQGTSITPSRLSIKRVVMLDKVSQEEIRFLNLGPNVQNSIIYSEGLIEARFDPIGVQGYQVVIFEKGEGSTHIKNGEYVPVRVESVIYPPTYSIHHTKNTGKVALWEIYFFRLQRVYS